MARPRSLRPALLALVGFLPIASSVSGCTSETHAQAERAAPPAVPIALAPVERAPVQRTRSVPGIVMPRDTYELGFLQGGLVREVYVEEGDEVRRGQLLARLDGTAQAATVEQASQGQVRAERDRDRARLLHEGGSLPIATLEDAETGASVAAASARAARFAMDRTALRAPADGRVDLRFVDEGEVVGAGMPVVRVVNVTRGYVLRVALTDREIVSVSRGMHLPVVLDAWSERSFDGVVVDVARVPTPGFGTFDVEIAIEASDVELRTGLVGRARVATGPTYHTSVPVTSLVDGHDREASVFAAESGHAVKHRVTLAFLVDDRAVLVEDLAGLESVVTDGAEGLRDGMEVRVESATARAEGAAR